MTRSPGQAKTRIPSTPVVVRAANVHKFNVATISFAVVRTEAVKAKNGPKSGIFQLIQSNFGLNDLMSSRNFSGVANPAFVCHSLMRVLMFSAVYGLFPST